MQTLRNAGYTVSNLSRRKLVRARQVVRAGLGAQGIAEQGRSSVNMMECPRDTGDRAWGSLGGHTEEQTGLGGAKDPSDWLTTQGMSACRAVWTPSSGKMKV